jgi:hypothetical protein
VCERPQSVSQQILPFKKRNSDPEDGAILRILAARVMDRSLGTMVRPLCRNNWNLKAPDGKSLDWRRNLAPFVLIFLDGYGLRLRVLSFFSVPLTPG